MCSLLTWLCIIWTIFSLPALLLILFYNYLDAPAEFSKELEEDEE